MAIARHSPHHQDPPLPTAKKHSSRKSPATRRLRSSSSEIVQNEQSTRPVLVPVHFNLRRLPSRRCLAQQPKSGSDSHMARNVVRTGSKRKRVNSINARNENIVHSTRANSRAKRLKTSRSYATRHLGYSTASEDDTRSEETEHDIDQDSRSEMEVDGSNAEGSDSVGSEEESPLSEEEEEEDEHSDAGDDESSDEHLLYSAEPKQLKRLRKDDLIRLYTLTGLSDDPETWTKSEIVTAILAARDDLAELPPSSPPRGDGNSSDGYSSDDGNVAGGEETDAGTLDGHRHLSLRRRATMDDATKSSRRPPKGRCASLGNLEHKDEPPHVRRKAQTRVPSTSNGNNLRQRSSGRPLPGISTPSPVITRLRSKSGSTTVTSPSTPTPKSSKTKGKGKPAGNSSSSDKTSSLSKDYSQPASQSSMTDESDLTELEEVEASLPKPSPRRLRSKDKEVRREPPSSEMQKEPPAKKRKLPTRKAKGKIKSLRESDLEDLEDEGEIDEVEIEDESEGEEVDELESPAASQQPAARTPLRRRLRPRQRPDPPSDGDDEGGSADEEQEAEEEEEVDEESTEVGDEDAEEEQEEEEEHTIVEPLRLRNGKVVGEEEDVSMSGEDVDEEDIENSEGEDEQEEEEAEEAEEGEEDVEVDAEGEAEEDEAMEDDDVDLTIATAKTLVRMRRDDLVRLCETRNLNTDGTKPQLAEALLQWRDTQYPSSPSSTGTIRPSSNRRQTRAGSKPPPILVRASHYMHEDEVATPVPTMIQREKSDQDAELELDLESLGLEDREIPPEKLQKLEKIGSGGFKDVFVGKFKGRKIAIAEFRGQLSAMDIKELKLLGGFDHPNIVRFLGVSIPENTRETPVMIISELCSNGDLFDYIRNVQAPPLYKVLAMMLDVARGLEYLHTQKPSVIHRDCKSSNILITARGTAKIADFGLAKVKQSTRSMVRSLVGTVNWQAPELWHAHPKYNHKVDVFSCSMVFWEMLQWHSPNIKFPWEGMNEHAIYEVVGTKRQRPSVAGLRKLWCPDIIDLIERMWAQDPVDRPTMSEVVEALEEMAANR